MSHGEGFLSLLGDRATRPGLYLLDEPDAALSFTGTLSLVVRLRDLVAAGAQVVVATHSPVLAALPGAHLLEVGGWGLREARWSDLELTASWRQFLDDPSSFLRHLS
jgi:predicted ATPase